MTRIKESRKWYSAKMLEIPPCHYQQCIYHPSLGFFSKFSAYPISFPHAIQANWSTKAQKSQVNFKLHVTTYILLQNKDTHTLSLYICPLLPSLSKFCSMPSIASTLLIRPRPNKENPTLWPVFNALTILIIRTAMPLIYTSITTSS